MTNYNTGNIDAYYCFGSQFQKGHYFIPVCRLRGGSGYRVADPVLNQYGKSKFKY